MTAAHRPSALLPAAVMAAMLLAACGQDPAPSGPVGPATPSAPVTAPSPSGDASAPGTTPDAGANPTPSPEAVMLPAGVQYLEPKESAIWGLPTGTDWATTDPGSRAIADGRVTAIVGTRGRQIRAAVRDATGGWQDVLVDKGTGVRGPGAYTRVDWLSTRGVAAGAGGYLVIGEESIADRGHYLLSRLGFSWFSRDGTHWARTDFRSVLGSGAAFAPSGVLATPDGWLVAGSLSNRNLKSKSMIVVLTSADGTHWSIASRLKATWGVTANGLFVLGDGIGLQGHEWACEADGHMLAVPIGSPKLRLWRSGDGGRAWSEADSTAGGVVTVTAPTPSSAKACTGGIGAYATSGWFLGMVDGRAMATSADHAKVATSRDLLAWQVGDLAGAVPAGGPASPSGVARSLAVIADGEALALLSLEGRRDEHDISGVFGSQVFAWRSEDGVSWTRLPASRPLEVTESGWLVTSPDGAVYLFDQKRTQRCTDSGCSYDLGPASYRRSVAGPLSPVPPCVLAKGADCSFSVISTAAAGADLSGIDLYGSEIGATADLSGANLTGANLTGAVARGGANLAGANLSGADLTRATLAGDVRLAGANLARATLTGATIRSTDVAGVSFAGADLSKAEISAMDLAGVTLTGATLDATFVSSSVFDADLTGAHVSALLVTVGEASSGLKDHDFGTAHLESFSFSGAGASGIGDLRGADFRHARVAGMTFANVDLTGARFPAGTRSQVDFSGGLTVFFSTGVTCPDGKPGTKVSFSYDCRLGQ